MVCAPTGIAAGEILSVHGEHPSHRVHRAALVEAHAVAPAIHIERVDQIPKTAMGKTPLIAIDQ